MTLRELGEDRLISQLTRDLALSDGVRVGAGDDCAVIGGPRDQRWQLLKADAVVEGVHFVPGERMQCVGWKALCRAISDIAAMGGVPAQALVTLGASPELQLHCVTALYSGLKKAARRFGVSIVGGETSRSSGPLFCSIALSGWVERSRCVLRSGGKPGDALYVTGRLGGSLASGRHLYFTPRLAEARWLTEHFRLRAMMDLSDGLASDLPRLASASRCGFDLWEDRIPRHRRCTLAQALGDGEDFELLFAISPRAAITLEAAWKQAFPRLPLTRVGTLTNPSPVNSEPSKPLLRGFDHFA